LDDIEQFWVQKFCVIVKVETASPFTSVFGCVGLKLPWIRLRPEMDVVAKTIVSPATPSPFTSGRGGRERHRVVAGPEALGLASRVMLLRLPLTTLTDVDPLIEPLKPSRWR